MTGVNAEEDVTGPFHGSTWTVLRSEVTRPVAIEPLFDENKLWFLVSAFVWPFTMFIWVRASGLDSPLWLSFIGVWFWLVLGLITGLWSLLLFWVAVRFQPRTVLGLLMLFVHGVSLVVTMVVSLWVVAVRSYLVAQVSVSREQLFCATALGLSLVVLGFISVSASRYVASFCHAKTMLQEPVR